MNIRPSAAIRQNYNEIADMCRKTAEQYSLQRMVKEIWLLWILKLITVGKKMLKLREELLAVEEDRIAGRNGSTLDELDAYLDDVIRRGIRLMSDKKYKVIVSDRAKRMLGTHIRFMAQVNKDAAKTKKQELMEAMRSLERMPQRFPFFEEAYIPTNKYHKMFVAKWYLVLYQIQDDTVYVDDIFDCRKDYSWLIR